MIYSTIFKISIALVCLACLFGCGGQKSVEMGPAETVEAFCMALTTGQWEEAEGLCDDTADMKEYTESHKQLWAKFEKEDEDAMRVAKSIMESTVVTINDMHKDDEKRIVTYTIEASNLKKTMKATVMKVEGAWKIGKITDAN